MTCVAVLAADTQSVTANVDILNELSMFEGKGRLCQHALSLDVQQLQALNQLQIYTCSICMALQDGNGYWTCVVTGM